MSEHLSSATITIGTGTKIIEARTVENLFCEVVLVCIEKQKSKNQDVFEQEERARKNFWICTCK